MASNLYPLLYRPGIQRDGTTFQPDFCIDGRWTRFQRGKIKKIGGMQGISLTQTNAVIPINVSNIIMVGTNIIIVSHTQGITKVTLGDSTPYPEFIIGSQPTELFSMIENNQLLWSTLNVIDKGNGENYLIFMKTPNAQNIQINNTASESDFKIIQVSELNNGTFTTLFNGIDPLSNGGMCFASPFLFLYGSKGAVQYSRSSSPFQFEGEDSGKFVISSDKVIFGAPIRGGSNSPSLLFWTLSSVVRVTNIGTTGVLFKNDVISNSSSILSSRCVVEYDGLFFWPGTDRFFVYNGIIQEMDNKINLNYFFDNIDMDRRQQVFGFRNAKFGEIWWIYPVKNAFGGLNSRAIVYNKRENFWYDTEIFRTAGMFSGENGYVITSGAPITPLEGDTGNYIWKHEVATLQNWFPASLGTDTRRNDPITSYIITPPVSFVAFPPRGREGSPGSPIINRWIELTRIEPDFVGPTTGAPSQLTVSVSTKEYAQSQPMVSTPIEFTSITPKIDLRIQGRNMNFIFSSTDEFEMGNIMLLFSVGDAR